MKCPRPCQPRYNKPDDDGGTAGRVAAAAALIVIIIARLGLENGEMEEERKESMHYSFLPLAPHSYYPRSTELATERYS